MMTEANEAAGMPPTEARSAALRQFGGVEQMKERYRDERGFRWLEDFFRDLGYAARALRKTPGLTTVIVLSLALGIGANTAMFSVVDAVLLRPLPYLNPERIVRIQLPSADGRQYSIPNGDFVYWREQNHVFDDIAAFADRTVTITGGDVVERVESKRVTANFFPLLGIKPMLGRTFLPEEQTPPGAPVVVLNYRMWQRRFGLDPNIIGKQLTLDGKTHDIVGVMPEGFNTVFHPGDDRTDLWRPNPFGSTPMNEYKPTINLQTIARLKPGISVHQAQAEMNTINAQIDQEYRKDFTLMRKAKVVVRPMHDWLVEKHRNVFWVLLGAVSLVLLIAVANVANLLLARAAARQKEIALRLALGAGRWRIVRQLLTEALLLALLGGAVGTLVAVSCRDALVLLVPANTLRAEEIGIDLRVLGFTMLVTVLTGLLFGLVPALKASKADLNDALNQAGRGATGGAGRQVLRDALVVIEVGLALVLLVGAGLMINSLVRLLAVDLGIQSEKVLSLQLTLPRSKYSETAGESSSKQAKPGTKTWTPSPPKIAFVDQALQRIEALPGVVSAGVTSIQPLLTNFPPWIPWFTFRIEGRPELPGAPKPRVATASVTPRYFETMGLALMKGRHFTEQDRQGAPNVAIASAAMARTYWPNENPIGKRVSNLPGHNYFEGVYTYEIVGIVADAKASADGKASPPTMFIPVSQHFWKYGQSTAGEVALFLNCVVRTAGEPSAIATAVRAVIKDIDPGQPVDEVATARQIIARKLSARYFAMVLLSLFAGVAVVLSAAGIYGVMAYAVTQRTHEIGVRMALGATRRDVLEMVIRRGMRFALVGVALGLAGAMATTHLLKSLLYEITPTDPLTAVVVTLLLTGVALLACYIPARRATKVDPMVALRCE
jgi:putative ABC transport system permease protein